MSAAKSIRVVSVSWHGQRRDPRDAAGWLWRCPKAVEGHRDRGADHRLSPAATVESISCAGGGVELKPLIDEPFGAARRHAKACIPADLGAVHETDTTLIGFRRRHARAHAHRGSGNGGAGARGLLTQTLEFERRMAHCFTKGLRTASAIWRKLARVLPRAESLFATPRQRLDTASDKLPARPAAQSANSRCALQPHRVPAARPDVERPDEDLR